MVGDYLYDLMDDEIAVWISSCQLKYTINLYILNVKRVYGVLYNAFCINSCKPTELSNSWEFYLTLCYDTQSKAYLENCLPSCILITNILTHVFNKYELSYL